MTVELESGISFSIPVVPVLVRDDFVISPGQKLEEIENFGPPATYISARTRKIYHRTRIWPQFFDSGHSGPLAGPLQARTLHFCTRKRVHVYLPTLPAVKTKSIIHLIMCEHSPSIVHALFESRIRRGPFWNRSGLKRT